MTLHHHFARALRLRRLHHHSEAGLMVTPLDHSVSDGPLVPRGSSLDRLVGQLAAGGADAIVLHKGSVRLLDPSRLDRMSLIIHLSASTAQAADPDAKYLVTGVEEALALGADAVSVHVNVGSTDERQQIADLGRVSRDCERWNLPLLAMMYARGPGVTDPQDVELIRHAVTVAADLGADLVKTVCPRSVADLLDVTAACPVPVLVAGGAARGSEDQVMDFVRNALAGGAAGVAMGRNIFQSADPRQLTRRVAALVHGYPAEEHTTRPAEGTRHEQPQTVLA